MMKTWQVVLATVLIFLAGLITGGAIALRVARVIANNRKLDREANQEQVQSSKPQQRPGVPQQEPQFGPQLIRRFAGQLDLTPAQNARVNAIARRTGGELTRLRRETQLTTALTIERMQDEIAAILTPPQRIKFETLLSQQRARLQQFIDERNEERKARQAQGQGQGASQGAGQGPKQIPSPAPTGP
jgi:Spy/CpxP family protein refolding chaperone